MNEITTSIIRDLNINEITGDEPSEISILYLEYKELISSLYVKYLDGSLYIVDEKGLIYFEITINNILIMSVIDIFNLDKLFNDEEITQITNDIFDELTCFIIHFITKTELRYNYDIQSTLKNKIRGIPIIYYKDINTFNENENRPNISYFFYDDFSSDYIGNFIDLEKFKEINKDI